MEEKTQEELLKETGGVITSITARGSAIEEEVFTEEEKMELLAGENKYNLN